jgi:8-oxo-dGTP diphosphatase
LKIVESKRKMTEIELYGAAVIIKNAAGKVLLGKRYKTVGEDTWAAPGGKLENNEDPASAAVREVKEETDLDLDAEELRPVGVFRNHGYGYAFNTYAFYTTVFKGVLKLIANEKHSIWDWFYTNNLPKPLFIPAQSILKEYVDHIERCL